MSLRSTLTPPSTLPWYWAAAHDDIGAKERFVVAQGQDVMWRRVRVEIDRDENCAWMPFGSPDPSLSDCFRVLINSREVYGVDFNTAMTELAQIPAFAEFVADKDGTDIHQLVSNPVQGAGKPLRRHAYDPSVVARLGHVVAKTLGLPEQWWDR